MCIIHMETSGHGADPLETDKCHWGDGEVMCCDEMNHGSVGHTPAAALASWFDFVMHPLDTPAAPYIGHLWYFNMS